MKSSPKSLTEILKASLLPGAIALASFSAVSGNDPVEAPIVQQTSDTAGEVDAALNFDAKQTVEPPVFFDAGSLEKDAAALPAPEEFVIRNINDLRNYLAAGSEVMDFRHNMVGVDNEMAKEIGASYTKNFVKFQLEAQSLGQPQPQYMGKVLLGDVKMWSESFHAMVEKAPYLNLVIDITTYDLPDFLMHEVKLLREKVNYGYNNIHLGLEIHGKQDGKNKRLSLDQFKALTGDPVFLTLDYDDFSDEELEVIKERNDLVH